MFPEAQWESPCLQCCFQRKISVSFWIWNFLFLEGFYLILAPIAWHSAEPQEENLSMNRYGVHSQGHVQCSCSLPLFLFMANTKSCEADAPVWAKAGKKLFVSLLEKGRRKGHSEALLGVAESQCALQCFSFWCCWGCPAFGWGLVSMRRGVGWRAKGKHRSIYLC